MGRQELDAALEAVRAATSAEQITGCFPAIHQALADIERKRGWILETAFGCVKRALWSLLPAELKSDVDRGAANEGHISMLQAVSLAVGFVEPLTIQTVGSTAESHADAIRERGIVAAMGLNLLGVLGEGTILAPRQRHLRSRLVSVVMATGVDMHVLLAASFLREELMNCRSALVPSLELDYESEDDSATQEETKQDDEQEDEEDAEMRREDRQWIALKLTTAWGMADWVYFLSDSGHEWAFASWTLPGIGVLAFSVFVERMTVDGSAAPLLTPILSPSSALFVAAAYAYAMLMNDKNEVRIKGMQLLDAFTTRCPEGGMACPFDVTTPAASFRDVETHFRRRSWVEFDVQAMTIALVSFPEASDRTYTLGVLRRLIAVFKVNDRFRLMKDLVPKCPFPNVSAVFVDCVRADAAAIWSSEDSGLVRSPYTSKQIVKLVSSVLAQAAEGILELQVDLIASCLSLYRFLHLRDKENRTGVHSRNASTLTVLKRIQRRLRRNLEEDEPMEQPVADHHGHAHTNTVTAPYLFVLEAALSSTLALLEPSQAP